MLKRKPAEHNKFWERDQLLGMANNIFVPKMNGKCESSPVGGQNNKFCWKKKADVTNLSVPFELCVRCVMTQPRSKGALTIITTRRRFVIDIYGVAAFFGNKFSFFPPTSQFVVEQASGGEKIENLCENISQIFKFIHFPHFSVVGEIIQKIYQMYQHGARTLGWWERKRVNLLMKFSWINFDVFDLSEKHAITVHTQLWWCCQ